jgi:SAM-dependent methyltransferase
MQPHLPKWRNGIFGDLLPHSAASSKGTLPMSELDQPAAISQRERDEDLEVSGREGGWLPGPSAPEEVLVPARRIPWLTESSPQAWDSYASAGGPDYLIADCGSPESHERRLRALLQLPIEEGDTLLEFGCGTGRLADFVSRGVRYEGLDWSREVITLARRRRPHGAFRCGSVGDLGPSDWVVASGPFNYAEGWSKSQTAEAVSAMWEASRRGIALTVLCIPADGRLQYDGGELISFLGARDWSHVELDRSYLPNDMCLRAWRER